MGINVWAKLVDCRPWPAYVITKRRPSAKHKNLIPVNFYGEEEEFAWIKEENIMEMTPDNLVDFSHDFTEDPEFFPALKQSYCLSVHPCLDVHCKLMFNSSEAMQTHIAECHSAIPSNDMMDPSKALTMHKAACEQVILTCGSNGPGLSRECSDLILSMLSDTNECNVASVSNKGDLDDEMESSAADAGIDQSTKPEISMLSEPFLSVEPKQVKEKQVDAQNSELVSNQDTSTATNIMVADQENYDTSSGLSNISQPNLQNSEAVASLTSNPSVTTENIVQDVGNKIEHFKEELAHDDNHPPTNSGNIIGSNAADNLTKNETIDESNSQSVFGQSFDVLGCGGGEADLITSPPMRLNARRIDGRVLCPTPNCGRTFGTDSALYGHMRVHGGAGSKRSRTNSTSSDRRRTISSGDVDSDSGSPSKHRRILSDDATSPTKTDDDYEGGKRVRRTRLSSTSEKEETPIVSRSPTSNSELNGPISRGLLFNQATIRIGDEYQADLAKISSREKKAKNDAALLWDPRIDHPGLDDFLKLACCKGIRGPGLERMKSRGRENAHHVFYKTYSDTKNQSKPVMTRALLELTLQRSTFRSKALRGYRYEGDSVWTDEEVKAFNDGLRNHGKNFPFIQTQMPTKLLPEIIEYYYYIKCTDEYKPIEAFLKQRERDELKRMEAEGVLICDHCGTTHTVEWHVGNDGQDWCDSCHAYFTKRTVTTIRPTSKSTTHRHQNKNKSNTSSSNSATSLTSSNKKQQRSVYKCKHCDKVFQLPNSLYGHMRVHTELRSPKQTKNSGSDKDVKGTKSKDQSKSKDNGKDCKSPKDKHLKETKQPKSDDVTATSSGISLNPMSNLAKSGGTESTVASNKGVDDVSLQSLTQNGEMIESQ